MSVCACPDWRITCRRRWLVTICIRWKIYKFGNLFKYKFKTSIITPSILQFMCYTIIHRLLQMRANTYCPIFSTTHTHSHVCRSTRTRHRMNIEIYSRAYIGARMHTHTHNMLYVEHACWISRCSPNALCALESWGSFQINHDAACRSCARECEYDFFTPSSLAPSCVTLLKDARSC